MPRPHNAEVSSASAVQIWGEMAFLPQEDEASAAIEVPGADAGVSESPPHPVRSSGVVELISANRERLRLIGTCLSIALLAISLIVLARTMTGLNWRDLGSAFEATGADQIVLALFFTGCSYLALTGYDAIALKQLKLRVPYKTTALASFTSYAISFTLGFPLITGGTVRYWIYSQAGLSAGRVASLTIIAGVTFWLGMGVVIGFSLVFAPGMIAPFDHLSTLLNILIGIGVLAVIGSYLLWVSRGHRRTRVQGLTLELPGFGLTLGQLVLGVIDLCCASSALYALLPAGTKMAFIPFAATYVFGSLLGIASNAPGGIGAFELTILKAVPAPTQEGLFASLLLFRAIYYLIPFVLALALIGAYEGLRRWTSLREAMRQSDNEDGAPGSRD